MIKLAKLNLPILILIIAIVIVLIIGIITLAMGGKYAQKYGNKLMMFRVILQGIIIMILLILFAKK